MSKEGFTPKDKETLSKWLALNSTPEIDSILYKLGFRNVGELVTYLERTN